MSELAGVIPLMLAFMLGLFLIPFGLPGLWLMVLSLIIFSAFTGFERVGWPALVGVMTIAALGEILEAWLGFRFAKRHGGSSRAGWGALSGGLVGALVGTPIPVLGSIFGAFLGAFIGAALLEHTRHGDARASVSAGWGAVLGRAAAAATKIALGVVIAVVGIYSALG